MNGHKTLDEIATEIQRRQQLKEDAQNLAYRLRESDRHGDGSVVEDLIAEIDRQQRKILRLLDKLERVSA